MTRRRLLPLVASVVLLAASAVAQQPTQAQLGAIRSSCRSDYQANCSSVPAGGRAALSCLQQHAENLSPACQQAVAAIGEGAPPSQQQAAPPRYARPPAQSRARGGVGQACRGDVRALCPGERPGGGRLLACLVEQRESLSPGCAQALREMRQER